MHQSLFVGRLVHVDFYQDGLGRMGVVTALDDKRVKVVDDRGRIIVAYAKDVRAINIDAMKVIN